MSAAAPQPPPDLRVELPGLCLRNPVLLASGCAGYGPELAPFLDYARLGGLCTKGLSLAPRAGNPPPRIAETASGMLNSIGLENVGVEAFLRDKEPYLRGLDCAVIANVLGYRPEEYAELVRRLDDAEGVDAYELNISCPNIEAGGAEFGATPAVAADVVARARRATRRPLLVKLAPAYQSIVELARAVADAGADALTVANTLPGMAVDLDRRRAVLSLGSGGLSGPALKPVTMHLVRLVSRAVALPVVASGGVSSWRDAAEYVLAGAHAVQVGTALFRDPGVPHAIADGLEAWMAREGLADLASFRGRLGKGG